MGAQMCATAAVLAHWGSLGTPRSDRSAVTSREGPCVGSLLRMADACSESFGHSQANSPPRPFPATPRGIAKEGMVHTATQRARSAQAHSTALAHRARRHQGLAACPQGVASETGKATWSRPASLSAVWQPPARLVRLNAADVTHPGRSPSGPRPHPCPVPNPQPTSGLKGLLPHLVLSLSISFVSGPSTTLSIISCSVLLLPLLTLL